MPRHGAPAVAPAIAAPFRGIVAVPIGMAGEQSGGETVPGGRRRANSGIEGVRSPIDGDKTGIDGLRNGARGGRRGAHAPVWCAHWACGGRNVHLPQLGVKLGGRPVAIVPVSDQIRLARRVADPARCPRTPAGQHIEGGAGRVDGDAAESPPFPVTTQAVGIDPDAPLTATGPATILLHKPVGVAFAASASLVTPDTHARVDPSGWRIHARHFDRLSTLMPLDAGASGLVVLSQDPRLCQRLCQRLTADAAELEQEFMVEVHGDTGPGTLSRLARGLRHRGRALPGCMVSRQNEALLRFAIKDVRPGQLRHMCGAVGLTTLTIKRVRIGRISLGKMPPGQWRYMPVRDRF